MAVFLHQKFLLDDFICLDTIHHMDKDVKNFIIDAIRHNFISVAIDKDGNSLYYVNDPETTPFSILSSYSHTDNYGVWCSHTIECNGTPVYIVSAPISYKKHHDRLIRDIFEIITLCSKKIAHQEALARKNSFLRAIPQQHTN